MSRWTQAPFPHVKQTSNEMKGIARSTRALDAWETARAVRWQAGDSPKSRVQSDVGLCLFCVLGPSKVLTSRLQFEETDA